MTKLLTVPMVSMMARYRTLVLIAAVFLTVAKPARAQHEHHATGDATRLGKVSFQTSCAETVQEQFNHAVALLPSFWYEAAEEEFTEVAAKDGSADLEDRIDKHPVTPGYVMPARELLGDLLLESNQPAKALAEYESALRSSPRRFNATYGAAHAAGLAGNPAKAAASSRVLVELAKEGDGGRAEVHLAREYLAQARAARQP